MYAVTSSDAYLGVPFDPAVPGSFRVPALARHCKTRAGVSRTQLPLLATAAALMGHKAQVMLLANLNVANLVRRRWRRGRSM